MSRLNVIEQDCQSVLVVILDYMGPGRRKITAVEHTELMGRVRDCLHRLINKEYGCDAGIHSGVCTCNKGGDHGRSSVDASR